MRITKKKNLSLKKTNASRFILKKTILPTKVKKDKTMSVEQLGYAKRKKTYNTFDDETKNDIKYLFKKLLMTVFVRAIRVKTSPCIPLFLGYTIIRQLKFASSVKVMKLQS